MQIRTLIVDDESWARKRVRAFLNYEPDIEIINECADGKAALDAIREEQPDLVLLDVQMPALDGIRLLEKLDPQSSPKIIFTTAYDRYALQAFEAHAVDYLLKPFGRERFRKAIQHARETIRANRALAVGEQVSHLVSAISEEQSFLQKLVFKSNGRLVILPVADLRYVTAEGNYMKLHADGRSELLRITISELMARLDPEVFIRIHRSALVNLKFVAEIRTGGANHDAEVVLADGTVLDMSRNFRQRLYELYHRQLRA